MQPILTLAAVFFAFALLLSTLQILNILLDIAKICIKGVYGLLGIIGSVSSFVFSPCMGRE